MRAEKVSWVSSARDEKIMVYMSGPGMKVVSPETDFIPPEMKFKPDWWARCRSQRTNKSDQKYCEWTYIELNIENELRIKSLNG